MGLTEPKQADEVFNFLVEALKSGTPLEVIVNELVAAVRLVVKIKRPLQ